MIRGCTNRIIANRDVSLRASDVHLGVDDVGAIVISRWINLHRNMVNLNIGEQDTLCKGWISYHAEVEVAGVRLVLDAIIGEKWAKRVQLLGAAAKDIAC